MSEWERWIEAKFISQGGRYIYNTLIPGYSKIPESGIWEKNANPKINRSNVELLDKNN